MPEASAAPPAAPLNASVAYLRIPHFEDLAVADQVGQKERLFARARDGLAEVPAAERAVLDADDGLAVLFLADPERALSVCEGIHQRDAYEALQVGLSYGPVARTSADGEPRVLGDGLAGACAAARFAEPDRLLVTDTFARALRISAPERAAELVKAGDFTDTRVRQHALYAPDPGRGALRRRRFALYAVGGVAAILLTGVIARGIYQPYVRSRPGTVLLDVQPRGEVYVDGVFHGRTPPMTEMQLPPGPHRIQIRNPGSAQYNTTLDVKPGERHTVSHTFARAPEPRARPRSDFWRDLKRKFGGS